MSTKVADDTRTGLEVELTDRVSESTPAAAAGTTPAGAGPAVVPGDTAAPDGDGVEHSGESDEVVLPAGRGWFSDVRGGFWAAATTLFCVIIAGGGHLILLAGDGQLKWEPIVGSSIAMVAIASFGGYFLASRRARVGIAASFVLTFFLLFSYLLTLRGLNTAIADAAAHAAALAVAQNGGDVAAIAGAAVEASASGATAAGGALQDILTEFRSYVALIIAFYFGTDAAVSAVKILKVRNEDAAEISRLDRDLATPRPPAS